MRLKTKRLLSALTALCLVVTTSTIDLRTAAQQSTPLKDPFASPKRNEILASLPPDFVQKATSPQAKEAWEKATPEQRRLAKDLVHKEIDKAHKQWKEEKSRNPVKPRTLKDMLSGKKTAQEQETTLLFDTKNGRQVNRASQLDVLSLIPARAQAQARPMVKGASALSSTTPINGAKWHRGQSVVQGASALSSCPDSDNDGLTDCFEDSLAAAFTPIYHVSLYEPDNFAIFEPTAPQTPQQLVGPNPLSHFRVVPYGWGQLSTGQWIAFVQIDYLTMWDHDSGLASEGNCEIAPGLSQLEGLAAHPLDNERSAALVGAPVAALYEINPDPYAYQSWMYYTAAHEGTRVDKSLLIYLEQPVSAGSHIHLALALSKHATYPFNPIGLPLVPNWVIGSAYLGVLSACARVWDDWTNYWFYVCLGAIYYLYTLFSQCAVEVWFENGAAFANTVLNIGEPSAPSSCCGFILDDPPTSQLYTKLITDIGWFN